MAATQFCEHSPSLTNAHNAVHSSASLLHMQRFKQIFLQFHDTSSYQIWADLGSLVQCGSYTPCHCWPSPNRMDEAALVLVSVFVPTHNLLGMPPFYMLFQSCLGWLDQLHVVLLLGEFHWFVDVLVCAGSAIEQYDEPYDGVHGVVWCAIWCKW